jgi:anthranilate synthase component 1
METPVSVLQKIRRGQHCFLLESVERGDQVGRYSFLGTDPHSVLTAKDGLSWLASPAGESSHSESECPDPLGELAGLVSTRTLVTPEGMVLPRFVGGAVGYAGYEIACTLEPVSPARRDPLGLPDLAFGFYDTVLVFDHVQRTAQVLTLAPLSGDPGTEYTQAVRRIEGVMQRLRSPLPEVPPLPGPPSLNGHHAAGVRSNQTREEFERAVETAKGHIAAGDAIQVVLSQRFERETRADPFTIYRALRMVNPSPYMFFLQFGDAYLVGASPEMLVQVQGRAVTTHPIAGTRPRGRDRREDERLERELVADDKERAEHLMLVDLGRNDVGRISRIGTVEVPRFMDVERYSHVMHLVSEVRGELRDDLRPVDALRACFPAGTVSGAPKVRAMQIISEQERDRRGPYAGAVGYIGYDGNMDTAITIRTVVVRGRTASVQAGAGIVADSVPESEYHETHHKARALLSAIDLAEEIECRNGPGGQEIEELEELKL